MVSGVFGIVIGSLKMDIDGLVGDWFLGSNLGIACRSDGAKKGNWFRHRGGPRVVGQNASAVPQKTRKNAAKRVEQAPAS